MVHLNGPPCPYLPPPAPPLPPLLPCYPLFPNLTFPYILFVQAKFNMSSLPYYLSLYLSSFLSFSYIPFVITSLFSFSFIHFLLTILFFLFYLLPFPSPSFLTLTYPWLPISPFHLTHLPFLSVPYLRHPSPLTAYLSFTFPYLNLSPTCLSLPFPFI